MKLKQHVYTLYTTVLIFCLSAYASAQRIEKPGFVREASPEQLDSAGSTLAIWIFGFIAVVIALSSIVPGYLFATDKSEEGWRWVKNILIGGVIAGVLGGIVFAVIAQFN